MSLCSVCASLKDTGSDTDSDREGAINQDFRKASPPCDRHVWFSAALIRSPTVRVSSREETITYVIHFKIIINIIIIKKLRSISKWEYTHKLGRSDSKRETNILWDMTNVRSQDLIKRDVTDAFELPLQQFQ